MASPTTFKGLTYPAHGASVNSWDTPLNTDFDLIDTMIGGTLALAPGSGTVSLTADQTRNGQIEVTGVLTGNATITLLSSVSGGVYCVDNQTTGAFSLSVNTSSTSALNTPIIVPQGGRSMLRCNGTTVNNADDNSQAKFYTQLGNPNGFVAGTAGAVSGDSTNVLYDQTNRVPWFATTTGDAASTIWTPGPSTFTPQCILSPIASTTSPVPTSDTTTTSIYCTPYTGNWTWLSNGSAIYPYRTSQLTLALTATQAANQIYDIFIYRDATAGVIIGTGPSWAAGGGSVAAGTGARGTGAGSTALTRLQGVLVNSVQVTLTNGASTYTCPASEGVYLGSIYVDAAAGQVTCHRSWGSSRKWGLWNMYNRLPVYLVAGDSTASWTYNSATWRAANGAATNLVTMFTGLAEEAVEAEYIGKAQSVGGFEISTAVGVNSTTSPSGRQGHCYTNSSPAIRTDMVAKYRAVPPLGINNLYALESVSPGGTAVTIYGTEANMVVSARWRA